MKTCWTGRRRVCCYGAATLAVGLLSGGSASAQQPSPAIESEADRKCHTVSPTGEVLVATEDGETMRGTLVCLSPSHAWLARDGAISRIPLPLVRRIRTPADPVWDGAAKGAVIPLIFWAVFCHSSCSPEPMLRASLAYGLIGLANDALDTNRETVYRGRARSVSVGWRFKF